MTSIASVFDKPVRKRIQCKDVDWVLPNQLVGIEIEVERMPGTKLQNSLSSYWTVHNDESLRSRPGTEYVLSMPLSGNELSRAVHSIFDGARFEKSITAGTHIHLDMQEDESTGHSPFLLKSLMLLTFCLESAIFAIADKNREWCGYTNKLCSAPDYLVGAVLNSDSDTKYEELKIICNENSTSLGRYYGLNFLALQKYGSVEFRYFPTASSAEELTDWIQLCMGMKLAAMSFGSVDEMYGIFDDQDSYEKFISKFFGKYYKEFISNVPQGLAAQMLKKALAIAGAYATASSDEVFEAEAITKEPAFKHFLKPQVKDIPTPASQLLIVEGMYGPPMAADSVPPFTIAINARAGMYYNQCVERNRYTWVDIGSLPSRINSEEEARTWLKVLDVYLKISPGELKEKGLKKDLLLSNFIYVIKDLNAYIKRDWNIGSKNSMPILASEPMRLSGKKRLAPAGLRTRTGTVTARNGGEVLIESTPPSPAALAPRFTEAAVTTVLPTIDWANMVATFEANNPDARAQIRRAVGTLEQLQQTNSTNNSDQF